MTTPEAIRALLEEGKLEEARRGVRAALTGDLPPADLPLWARLAEEAGLTRLALKAYAAALRARPADPELLERLATLHQERGDLSRALRTLETLLQVAPDHPARAERDRLRTRLELPAEAAAEPSPPRPTEADAVRFCHLFAGREDLYARQWASEDGRSGYAPVRGEPFTPRVAVNHLLGNVTVGIYPVRVDQTATFCAFDVDITRRALEAAQGDPDEVGELRRAVHAAGLRLLRELRDLGLPGLLEDSGFKGRHVWLFLARPEKAAVLHAFGRHALKAFAPPDPRLHLEFFPKQARVTDVGNLIKLPLGIHRRTGRWSRLLDDDGRPLADPHARLRTQPRVSREALYGAIRRLRERAARAPAPPPPEPRKPDLPPPPPPPPAWTDADFDTQPEIQHLLRSCPVLAELRNQAETHRKLSADERIVLIHTLGHLAPGVNAVNYLLERAPETPPDQFLKSPLAGNPISCPKIRKRIPHVTGRVDCHCDFSFAPNHYPTPLLHLRTLKASPPPKEPEPAWARSPEETARALSVLLRRAEDLRGEIARLRRELLAHMDRLGTDRVPLPGGAFVRKVPEGGPPVVEWEEEKG